MVFAGLRWTDRDQDRHIELLHPRQQIREPAQRRQIAPLQVVNHEQQPPALDEVYRQPVQPVQRRQRRIASRPIRDLSRIKNRRRERSGSRENAAASLRAVPTPPTIRTAAAQRHRRTSARAPTHAPTELGIEPLDPALWPPRPSSSCRSPAGLRLPVTGPRGHRRRARARLPPTPAHARATNAHSWMAAPLAASALAPRPCSPDQATPEQRGVDREESALLRIGKPTASSWSRQQNSAGSRFRGRVPPGAQCRCSPRSRGCSLLLASSEAASHGGRPGHVAVLPIRA